MEAIIANALEGIFQFLDDTRQSAPKPLEVFGAMALLSPQHGHRIFYKSTYKGTRYTQDRPHGDHRNGHHHSHHDRQWQRGRCLRHVRGFLDDSFPAKPRPVRDLGFVFAMATGMCVGARQYDRSVTTLVVGLAIFFFPRKTLLRLPGLPPASDPRE